MSKILLICGILVLALIGLYFVATEAARATARYVHNFTAELCNDAIEKFAKNIEEKDKNIAELENRSDFNSKKRVLFLRWSKAIGEKFQEDMQFFCSKEKEYYEKKIVSMNYFDLGDSYANTASTMCVMSLPPLTATVSMVEIAKQQMKVQKQETLKALLPEAFDANVREAMETEIRDIALEKMCEYCTELMEPKTDNFLLQVQFEAQFIITKQKIKSKCIELMKEYIEQLKKCIESEKGRKRVVCALEILALKKVEMGVISHIQTLQ